MSVPSSIGVPVRKAVTDGLAEHLGALSDFNGTAAAERKTAVAFAFDFTGLPREHVYTGRSRAETPPAGMRSGRNTRNETGHFDLTVMVRSVGGDAYEAEERAEAIGGEVESWFADRKNNELGVTGLNSLVVESWEADYAKTDNGAAALRTYVIRWTARLE
jgi:hypothetical protein